MEISFELSEKIQNAVEKHSISIIRVAFTYVKNLSDAEDIAQDVFLAYMLSNPILENDVHEKAWLIRIAINKSKDHVKSQWFKKRSPLHDNLSYRPKESSDLLQTVLELDSKYKIPIHLYYYEGYTIKEIAEILKTRPSTVATWLDRGRGLIKKKIGVMLDE